MAKPEIITREEIAEAEIKIDKVLAGDSTEQDEKELGVLIEKVVEGVKKKDKKSKVFFEKILREIPKELEKSDPYVDRLFRIFKFTITNPSLSNSFGALAGPIRTIQSLARNIDREHINQFLARMKKGNLYSDNNPDDNIIRIEEKGNGKGYKLTFDRSAARETIEQVIVGGAATNVKSFGLQAIMTFMTFKMGLLFGGVGGVAALFAIAKVLEEKDDADRRNNADVVNGDFQP